MCWLKHADQVGEEETEHRLGPERGNRSGGGERLWPLGELRNAGMALPIIARRTLALARNRRAGPDRVRLQSLVYLTRR